MFSVFVVVSGCLCSGMVSTHLRLCVLVSVLCTVALMVLRVLFDFVLDFCMLSMCMCVLYSLVFMVS